MQRGGCIVCGMDSNLSVVSTYIHSCIGSQAQSYTTWFFSNIHALFSNIHAFLSNIYAFVYMHASPLTELGGLKTWDRPSRHLDRSASIWFFSLISFCYGFKRRPKTTDVPATTLSPLVFWRGRINHTQSHHICILRVLCLHFSVFALVGI